MDELFDGAPFGGASFGGRNSERGHRHHGDALRHAQNFLGVLRDKCADMHGPQPKRLRRKAQVFHRKPHVIHEPIALGGDRLALVVARLPFLRASHDDDRGLLHGLGRGVSGRERSGEFLLDGGVFDDNDFPALGIGPRGRPLDRLEHGHELGVGNGRVFVLSYAAAGLNGFECVHSISPSGSTSDSEKSGTECYFLKRDLFGCKGGSRTAPTRGN